MRKKDVQIGETYIVKVSGNLVPVRLTGESRYGGWDGVNTKTKRSVRVKTAARLRRLAKPMTALRAPKEATPQPELALEFVAQARQRIQQGDKAGPNWVWFQCMTEIDRRQVDDYLVREDHPLAYVAGTPYDRFLQLVREAIS